MSLGAGRLLGAALLLASFSGCARPEERKETPVKAVLAGEPTFAGVPAAGLLAGAVETDVPGELTMRVPGEWIGQQKLTPGHALFTSRDGRSVITVTEAAPETFSDAGVLTWAAKPWTKVTTPSVTPFRPLQLGRSVLPAEQAGGTALVEGKPAKAAYVRLKRITAKGTVAVLITTFVQNDAPAGDHALAEAIVRSLGTR